MDDWDGVELGTEVVELSLVSAKGKYDSKRRKTSIDVGMVQSISLLTIHTSIVYSLIGVTVDEPTEVVGLAGVTEVVGLAGSLPAEDGCVQMLSSVTEDKLSEVSNDVTYHAGP